MKLTGYELYKVWSRRGFIILVAALIMANVFLLWYMNRPSEDGYSLSEYGKLNAHTALLKEEEVTAYLEKLHEDYQDEEDSDYLHEIAYAYMEPEYTGNVQSEKKLVDDFYNEWKQITGYKDFLGEVSDNSQVLSSISIFTDSNKKTVSGFSERNIEKTSQDYSGMSDIQTQFHGGKGVEGIFSFDITEYLIVLNIIIMVSILFHEEKDKQLYSITRAAAAGRGPLICAKLIALLTGTIGITAAFYVTNMVFYEMTAGIGDMGRSIQSVPAYMDTLLRINVGEFIFGNIMLKAFGYVLLGMMITLITLLLKNSVQILLVFIAVYGSGVVLWNVIERTSGLVLLKFLNPEGLMKTEELTGRYCNANVFGMPVAMWVVEYVVAGLVFISLTAAAVMIFCKMKGMTAGKSKLAAAASRKLRLPIPKSLLGHELYKSGVMYRTLAVFVIFVFMTFNNITNIGYYMSPAEQYYKNCMEYLEGELTPAKENWLNKKEQQYDKLFAKLDDIEEMYGDGELSKQEAESLRMPIESKTAFYDTFCRVVQKKDYISRHSGSEFVYEKGYYMLLGADYKENLLQLIGIITVLVLMLSPVHAMEYKTNMNRLIRTTPLGRDVTRRAKHMYSIGTVFMVSLLMIIRNVYVMSVNYGLPNCSAGISGILKIASPYGKIPILAALIIVYMFVILVINAIGMLILLISAKTRNVIYSMLISMSVLVLPLVIVYLMNQV